MAHVPTRHPGQPFAIDRHNSNALQFGVPQQVARARVVTLGINENFENCLRLMPQFGDDGVKTVNEAGLGHKKLEEEK